MGLGFVLVWFGPVEEDVLPPNPLADVAGPRGGLRGYLIPLAGVRVFGHEQIDRGDLEDEVQRQQVVHVNPAFTLLDPP